MKATISKEFTGIFKEEFENFLEYKKALGQYKNIDGKLLYDSFHQTNFYICPFFASINETVSSFV